MTDMNNLASSLINLGQGILTIKQLRTMKVPVLAIASTALLAGLAYRILKSPGAAENKELDKKPPIRTPGVRVNAKGAAATAQELTDDVSTRIHKEYVKYKKASVAKMRSYDKILVDLKEKLAEAGDEVKDKYKEVLADAEKRTKQLKNSMMSFKVESKEQWAGFKRDFTRDLESLGKDLKGIALS